MALTPTLALTLALALALALVDPSSPSPQIGPINTPAQAAVGRPPRRAGRRARAPPGPRNSFGRTRIGVYTHGWPALTRILRNSMSKKKQKSRKKLPQKRLDALELARLCNDARLEARRPLGFTSSHQPENSRAAKLHGSVAALTLMCACALGGGVSASCLALSALPKTKETRIRDAHAGELHSFVICEGVVPEELKQQAPARSHSILPNPS